jgi:hypothetical protein
VATLPDGKIIGLCPDGTIWYGKVTLDDEWDRVFLQWEPVNGPPDGEIPQRMRKGFWDRMEAKYGSEAQKESK